MAGSSGFKVVSYNILGHHSWYWDDSWPAKMADFPWVQRLQVLEHELSALDADVVCCQEVTQDMFASLNARLAARGYIGLHALRHLPEWTYDERWESSQLGIAIFVWHSKFEVVEASHRFARDLLQEDERQRPDTHNLSMRLLARPDSVMICRLRLKQRGSPPKDLLIACAHAVWWYTDDPQYPISCKPVQIMLMLRAIDDFARSRGLDTRRVVLCGDFNTLSCSGSSSSKYDDVAGYELLTTGLLATGHPEHPAQHGWALFDLKAPFCMQSAYVVKLGREPSFTSRTSTFTATMDYIFVGDAIEVVDVLPLPEECPPCPNKDHPSDHLPIGANLRMKPWV
ncbi:CCR4 [Symbiodinium natans]|uniref:CCR4 protein n=1 Tax=Symbiodinium natans TaxID=878477 RepID=A0A812KQX0_9DINO|nr:CCR4 [Symbiodinium natans]